MPVPVAKMFGPKYGVRVYSIVVLGALLSSMFDMACIVALYDTIGIKPIFELSGSFAAIALMVCLCFDEKLDVEKMEKKGLLDWEPAKAYL
jgi:hypothetical protein